MIALPESLTMADARGATETLVAAVTSASGDHVALDASGLLHLDTAAVATLLACQRAAQAVGKTLVLHRPPRRLGQLADLYGVAELLKLSPDPT